MMKPESQTQKVIQELTNFVSLPLESKLQPYSDDQIAATVINLFQNVANNVPAYQEFLANQGIESQSIQSLADFQKLPKVNKENYISKYPLSQLCYHGKLENCDFIAASSGSTGKSTFWP
ncbi:MAG: hypothetical protein RLZZ203_2093, partial [Cyanobacteriota bacterium]